jgi:hypothetical protein
MVARDKVIVGNSGGEFGVRGWVTALDANSGKIAWRAYNTGPDTDCLIGPNFKPFIAIILWFWPKRREHEEEREEERRSS